MNNRGLAFLSTLTLVSSVAYGCGSEVVGSGATTSGGPGGAPSSSSEGGSASDGIVSSSAGFGGAGVGTSGEGGFFQVSSSASGSGGSAPGCTPKTGAILAVTKMYFGDTNFDDSANKVNGWKQYGFNVDGKVSTAMSVDLCQPMNNASPKNVYPDGDNGIDNSFGKNILPIFLGLSSNFSANANQQFTDGDYTMIFDLQALGPSADQAPLASKIYTGTPLLSPPKFDGSDCWPVAPEGLANPADIASAKPFFAMGTVAANHWDSGPTATTIPLQIDADGFKLHLDIHHARVSMNLDPDHQGAQMGQLGGVVDTAQLVAEMKKVAGAVDPSLCSGPTIDSIAAQLEQASDILADGTQDPTKTCDGISIGIGFKATALSLGGVGPATPPQPNPCAP
jgi:hypothetical protein